MHALAWERPALVPWLAETGEVPESDARATLNLGIRMVLVCAPEEVDRLARDLARAGERGVEWTEDSGP